MRRNFCGLRSPLSPRYEERPTPDHEHYTVTVTVTVTVMGAVVVTVTLVAMGAVVAAVTVSVDLQAMRGVCGFLKRKVFCHGAKKMAKRAMRMRRVTGTKQARRVQRSVGRR
jgi:hypothetical protein